jgi:pilus assembly protein Flp/PilA
VIRNSLFLFCGEIGNEECGLWLFTLSCRLAQTFHPLEKISMKNFAAKIRSFLKSEDGPTAVEYAVMLALIVVVCLGAIRTIGTNATATFNKVSQQLK